MRPGRRRQRRPTLRSPRPAKEHPLADRRLSEFIDELARRGVPRIEVGDVIVATWEPHETTVLQTIHDLGLELQIIFNKGAVMILPTGVNKATGLAAALKKLGISRHNTVGVGDAENDEAFLKLVYLYSEPDFRFRLVLYGIWDSVCSVSIGTVRENPGERKRGNDSRHRDKAGPGPSSAEASSGYSAPTPAETGRP